MKKISVFLLLLTTIVYFVSGQNEKELENPDEQIIVNKEYDENGNLIAFDSTYIHKWSSDTMLNFSEKDLFAGNMFPDLERFMEGFTGDSTFYRFDFPDPFFGSPFADDDLFDRFEYAFPDSTFVRNFEFKMDSMPFDREFVFPDMKILQEQMEEHFKHFDLQEPRFKENLTEEQKKDLEKLKKKHQKEMEELRKKWEEKK
jgi:hypothetical protein